MKHLLTTCAVAALSVLASCGCGGGEGEAPAQPTTMQAKSAAPTNRIDVPAGVRQNLGITFAKVERRRVASTIRVPGRFELLPTARREYRATLGGYVRLNVTQYEPVAAGEPVYRLDSPDWHTLKHELHDAEVGIERATAEMTVAERAKAEAEQVVAALQKRVDVLAGAEVRRAELDADLTAKRAAIPRLDAEIGVKRAELEEARHDFEIKLARAATLLGKTPAELTTPVKNDGEQHVEQRWYGITQVGLDARAAGVVETIGVSDGTWVEANALVAVTVDPTALRFRAVGLQSDLAKLRDGLDAAVVRPGGGVAESAALAGKLRVAPVADPQQRTVDLIVPVEKPPAWARPGVSSFVEIVTDGGAEPEPAIPVAAVVRDGLKQIFFRRDPRDPDKVIRVEADLGTSDGRWVAMRSGVKDGDEVVLDGVYELKLAGGAGGAGATGGGHFHADGTWHAEADKPEGGKK